MSLSGTAYPCARCFKTTASVIDEEQYDKDETPPRVGVRFRRSKKIFEIVCAACLRADYAAKISPAKKIIHSPAKSIVRAALRNDDDEDDADDDAEDSDVSVPIKPLPRPSGLIVGDDYESSAKKKKKFKKKFKTFERNEDDSLKLNKKLKKKLKKLLPEPEGDD